MMSDNDIRKGFQSKLSGFEAPVPPDGWESVERSLKAAAAARMALHRRWYAGSVAAVLVLLVGSILFMRNPMEQPEAIVSETVLPTPFTDNAPDPGTESAQAPESRSGLVARPAGTGRLLAASASPTPGSSKEAVLRPSMAREILVAWMERERLQIKGVEKRMDGGALRLLVRSMEADVEHNGIDLPEEETIVVGGDEEVLFAGGGAAERGEGTLLLAFNGRGGLTGYRQTVNSPMTLRSATVAPEHKYMSEKNKIQVQANNTPGNVSEMEHDQPVSFGITVSKYLLDDLSVETGLVYSYLHSKTRNANNNFRVEEVQKLHYLGIPVNVNYNLFSLGGLNVYASVGGMVEKDVYGEFRRIKEGQAVNLNNASEDSEEKEITEISQRNPQLSVNVGMGLSYPLYDRLRLYGKIGGAYYFDAGNEYKTIYSDRKIVMDLNVGLRYEF